LANFALFAIPTGGLPSYIFLFFCHIGRAVAQQTNMKNDFEKRAYREVGKKNMVYGALWCIGGTLVTVCSYQAASAGGHYIIAWGAVVFGAFQFFKGLAQLTGNL
jgi:hypothetical protein